MTKLTKYKIVSEFPIEAKDKDEAWEKFNDIVADLDASAQSLYNTFEIEYVSEFKSFLEISVDDIFEHAKQEGKKLTKAQAQKIFDNFDRTDVDCENSTFWSHIEYLVERFLEKKN
jgi:hypothetical protein